VGIRYNSERYKHAVEVAESSLNAAMASRVFMRWAEALKMAQHAPASSKLPPPSVLQRAEEAATAFAAGQRTSLQQHAWNGSWFSRAWVDESEGWVGTTADDRLALEPQGWAMVGGAVAKGSAAGGRDRGAQGAHLNPPGLFLRTSIPFIWRVLRVFPPTWTPRG
jgi:hypothetical protein